MASFTLMNLLHSMQANISLANLIINPPHHIYQMIKAISLLVLLVLTHTLPPQQPIIGIYTQDAEDFGQGGVNQYSTYIAASYVKNLQMAGAQVIPLFYHYSQAKLDDVLSKINGVFFPGGEMPIDTGNQWTANTAYIMEYATRQNQLGNPYPIWATCLGYQAVMYLYSGQKDNMTVLTQVFGQDGGVCPLNVKTTNSKLMKALSTSQMNDIKGDGLMYFHHRWAVTAKTYISNTRLNSFWRLITTTNTKDGVEFVSTVQAFDYPYFMTQYHPEKNSFEWRVPATRTYNSISVEQKFINVFMKVARENSNKFTDENELKKMLVGNWQPALTPLDYAFVQVYLFDEKAI